MGTVFQNIVLKERYHQREDEEEGMSSHWISLSKNILEYDGGSTISQCVKNSLWMKCHHTQ
jgi:hypothetical protein